MIIKILGVLDIITAALFWIFSFFGIIPESFILVSAIYLITKGIIFVISDHFASVADIIAGIAIFASLSFAMPAFVIIIITLYLAQKGIFSLF